MERVVVTGAELRLKKQTNKQKESKQPFTQPLTLQTLQNEYIHNGMAGYPYYVQNDHPQQYAGASQGKMALTSH